MNSEESEISFSQKHDPTDFNPASGGHIEQKDGHAYVTNYVQAPTDSGFDETPRCEQCERLLRGRREMAMGICDPCRSDEE